MMAAAASKVCAKHRKVAVSDWALMAKASALLLMAVMGCPLSWFLQIESNSKPFAP